MRYLCCKYFFILLYSYVAVFCCDVFEIVFRKLNLLGDETNLAPSVAGSEIGLLKNEIYPNEFIFNR